MKARTILERKRTRIDELLSTVERDPALRDSYLPDIVDEVMGYVAAEENVLHPAAEDALHVSRARLQSMYAVSRITLFRIATAVSERDRVERQLGELRRIFAEHTQHQLALVEELERALPAPERAALEKRLEAYVARDFLHA